jgi:hypothetical protein
MRLCDERLLCPLNGFKAYAIDDNCIYLIEKWKKAALLSYITDFIKDNVPSFDTYNQKKLERISKIFTIREYNKNDSLVFENKAQDQIILIFSGKVKLTSTKKSIILSLFH